MPDAITRKVAALADASGLPEYLGKPTVRTTIAVTNTGDGLSQAMAVDPVVYEPGSTQYVVIECDVPSHTFELNEDGDAYELKQKLRGGVAVVVDADLVKRVVDEQRERIRKARDEAQGIMAMPFEAGSDDESDGPLDEPPPADSDELSGRRKGKRAASGS